MNRDVRFRHRQRGVALVIAIFLLVVLAGLGAFAVRLSLFQQQTTGGGLLAAQALQAAKSGVAWAAHRAINTGWCATASVPLTEGGAAGFTVTVNCSQSTHTEGGATLNVYIFDVLAESGSYGTPDYVSRRLEAKVVAES
jgi:MSHA biogenesis protein MshP